MYVLWFLVQSAVWSVALLGLAGVVLDVTSNSGLNCSVALAASALLLIVGVRRRWRHPYGVAVVGGLSTLGLVILLAAADWSVAATLFVIGSSAHLLFLGLRAAIRPQGHHFVSALVIRRLRRSTAAILLGATLLAWAPPPAAAGIVSIFPGPDPVELALLAKIITACNKVYLVLHGINQRVEQFRNLQSLMFPRTALMQIETLFRNVASIKEEFEDLACGWKFSPRIEGIRLGLLRKGPLCREEYENVFGRVLPGIDSDLKEMRAWASVRRMNSVASTIEASGQWTQAAASYANRARSADTSPGRALRYVAALNALGLQQEVVAGKHEAGLLSAAQEDLDAEMRKDWLDQNYAMNVTEWTAAAIDQLHREGGLGAALVR